MDRKFNPFFFLNSRTPAHALHGHIQNQVMLWAGAGRGYTEPTYPLAEGMGERDLASCFLDVNASLIQHCR